jgi:hypothetical protein
MDNTRDKIQLWAVRSLADVIKYMYKNDTMAVELHCFVSFFYLPKDGYVA